MWRNLVKTVIPGGHSQAELKRQIWNTNPRHFLLQYSPHLSKALTCQKFDFEYVVVFGSVVPLTVCFSTSQQSVIYCLGTWDVQCIWVLLQLWILEIAEVYDLELSTHISLAVLHFLTFLKGKCLYLFALFILSSKHLSPHCHSWNSWA